MDKERIYELENVLMEFSKTYKQKEQRMKNIEQNSQGLRDYQKRYNTCIIGIPKGEEKEKTVMAEFPQVKV